MTDIYEERSHCCEAAVWEWNSMQYPSNVTPYSRCVECGEHSKVVFLNKQTGKEVNYDTAYRSTE
jgi:hypothetical protein